MSWGGVSSGAAAGASIGGPWGALAGGILGGFLGPKKPKIPKELRRIYKFQMGLADQQRRFAQSTPLSTPEEINSLGQEQGFLGEQQQQQREQLGSLYNPLTMGRNAPNALLNLGNQQIGQQMNLHAQALMSALQQRRQALLSASGIAANAAGAVSYQQQPQADVAGSFQGLARAIAMQRAMGQQQQQEQIQQRDAAYPGYLQGQLNQNNITDAEMFTTQGANRPFNPVAQTQGLSLPQNWTGVGPSGTEQNTMALPGSGPGGGGGGQVGWNFGQPRRFFG